MSGFSAEEFEPDLQSNGTGSTSGSQSNGTSSAGSQSNGNGTASAGAMGNPRPELADEAYYGIAGEIVSRMAPQTEADPVALLLQLLVYFGNAIGRGPYVQVGKDRHYPNLFGLLVGATAKARKGLSAGHIRDFYLRTIPEWAESRIRGGLSSGEGVVHHIRDEVKALRKGEMTVIDPGVSDKRLLVDEREFQAALAVMRREGSTLSATIRDAWDCIRLLGKMTKREPSTATNAFISIVGHITLDELQGSLDATSMANGYANRFLFAFIHRSQLLPFGGDDVDLDDLLARMQVIADTARTVERVTLTDDARELWSEVYPELSEGQPGLLGAITARAEAQTLRLALVYALLDGATQIDPAHIEAGLAMWKYCEASARFIFGDMLGNKIADAILLGLRRAAPAGMTRTDINNLLGGNSQAGDIAKALGLLLTAGKARFVKTPSGRSGGRPTETWYSI